MLIFWFASNDQCGYLWVPYGTMQFFWSWFRFQQVTAVVEKTTPVFPWKQHRTSQESFRSPIRNIHIFSQPSMTRHCLAAFPVPIHENDNEYTERRGTSFFYGPELQRFSTTFTPALGSPNALPHPWIWPTHTFCATENEEAPEHTETQHIETMNTWVSKNRGNPQSLLQIRGHHFWWKPNPWSDPSMVTPMLKNIEA